MLLIIILMIAHYSKYYTYTVVARQERSAERILVTKKINKKKPLNNVVEQVDNQISNLAAGEFASLSKGAQAPDSLECIICSKETL